MIWFYFLCFVIAAFFAVFPVVKASEERSRRQSAEDCLKAIYQRKGTVDEVVWWHHGNYPSFDPNDRRE